MGMQIDTATMKDSMEVWSIPLKTRNKTTMWPSKPLLGVYPEETKIEKDTCNPMFIVSHLILCNVEAMTLWNVLVLK